MTITPPRPPRRSTDPVERDEFEVLVEALIEEARQRARRRRRIYLAVATFVALGAAGIFAILDRTAEAQTTSPAAEPSSLSAVPRQRVAITAGGAWGPTSAGKFVLTPVGVGALEPDSGTETSVVRSERVVVRNGQEAEIVAWITTAKGKHGSFVLRVRIDHVDAGNGFGIGTGTWTLVRGTGAYADATGGGRVSQAESEASQRWSERRDGFIAVRS